MTKVDKRAKRKQKAPRKPTPENWLICCEGKTEAIYFTELVKVLANGRPHGIHIGIKGKCTNDHFQGECGRQHVDLVNKVERCQKQGTFSQIWIVFDFDAYGEDTERLLTNFINAIKKIEESQYLNSAWSIPKFEYWLALHGNSLISSGTSETIERKVQALISTAISNRTPCQTDVYTKGDNCSKSTPTMCDKAKEKPYCNCLNALGYMDGVNNAIQHSKRCFNNLSLSTPPTRNELRNISVGSNVHMLVEALIDYFNNL